MSKSNSRGQYRQQNSSWLVLFLLIIFGCDSPPSKEHYNDVVRVTFSFLSKGINPDMAISDCDAIFEYGPVLKDTSITDKIFINKLLALTKQLKQSNAKANYDFRIMATIYFDNNEKKQLCLGEGYLTVVDGFLMDDNKELFLLIDKTLYSELE